MIKWVSSAAHRYFKIPYTLNTYEFQSPKRPKATYVLIHGIGNNLHSWDEVVRGMPRNVRVVGIDLLGFGKSPSPKWGRYDARTQARSVGATLLKMGLLNKTTIVGHSLGSLVAVEVAKRYPLLVRRLVLCSPPFYRPRSSSGRPKSADDALRAMYEIAKKHPRRLIGMSTLAVKAGIANKSLSITDENVAYYIAALEASIINQTSLRDVSSISADIDIFYGTLDPVVINSHIVKLAKSNKNITAHRLISGHEVVGGYAKSVSRFLSSFTSNG